MHLKPLYNVFCLKFSMSYPVLILFFKHGSTNSFCHSCSVLILWSWILNDLSSSDSCCLNWPDLTLSPWSLCDICSDDSCCLWCSCLSLELPAIFYPQTVDVSVVHISLEDVMNFVLQIFSASVVNLWPSVLQVSIIVAPLQQLVSGAAWEQT